MTDLHLNRTAVAQKHRGCWAEMVACCWLLQQGYEVFRNVSQHGNVDIVAIKDGDAIFIDVKSASSIDLKCGTVSVAIGTVLVPEPRIKVLYVCDDGFCCYSREEVFFHITGRKPGDRHQAKATEASCAYWLRIEPAVAQSLEKAKGNVSKAAELLNAIGVRTVGGSTWKPSNLAGALKRHGRPLGAIAPSAPLPPAQTAGTHPAASQRLSGATKKIPTRKPVRTTLSNFQPRPKP